MVAAALVVVVVVVAGWYGCLKSNVRKEATRLWISCLEYLKCNRKVSFHLILVILFGA